MAVLEKVSPAAYSFPQIFSMASGFSLDCSFFASQRLSVFALKSLP